MKSIQPTTMIIINIVLFLDVLSDAGTGVGTGTTLLSGYAESGHDTVTFLPG